MHMNTNEKFLDPGGRRGCNRIPLWYMKFDLQLPVPSVPITTIVVTSNPIHCEVYSMQHYMTKFVSDLQQVGGFLVSSTNKTDCHEILLKVVLNIINPITQTIFKTFLRDR